MEVVKNGYGHTLTRMKTIYSEMAQDTLLSKRSET